MSLVPFMKSCPYFFGPPIFTFLVGIKRHDMRKSRGILGILIVWSLYKCEISSTFQITHSESLHYLFLF